MSVRILCHYCGSSIPGDVLFVRAKRYDHVEGVPICENCLRQRGGRRGARPLRVRRYVFAGP